MKTLCMLFLTIAPIQAQNLDRLVNAMIQVESKNNPAAVNQKEQAFGVLQIRPIMIAEINRICLPCSFKHEEAFSRGKSIRMFKIWYYMNGISTHEEAARKWNGGYKGMNKPATLNYWNKVKAELNNPGTCK